VNGVRAAAARDPKMPVRKRRQVIGLLSYLMFLLPLAYATHFGWTTFGYRGLAAFGLAAVAINVVFYVAVASGWSQRFRDPSLTFSQIATAIGLALLMLHNLQQSRGPFLMLLFTVFVFGLFGMSTRQFLALALAALGGYIAMVAFEFRGQDLANDTFRLEVLRVIVLCVVILWISFLGGYVTSLRERVKQQKVELEKAFSRLTEQASRDELTGAYNRRHLLEIMAHERERAERHGHPFAVCILDIDHFKRFNDTHGHQVGDEVLKGFAERMKAKARKLDWVGRQDPDHVFGRFGGEEFLLVLPQTPAAGALVCVERMRLNVRDAPFATSAGPMAIAFSAGVAEYVRGESLEQMLARADAALYRAKAAGRDCTELAEGEAEASPPGDARRTG
jgi:diguanylate cyclase (GGDEF)-like protein